MRFVLAVMRHETNTFSPLSTPLAAFGRGAAGGPKRDGEAIDAYRDTNNPVAAYIDIAERAGAEIVLPIAANAHPSGRVTAEAFEAMAGAICEAVASGCDAVLLDLHGAMVAEGFDDGEGELLQRIRAIAPEVPVAVALDFHTNLTAAMVQNATAIAGYCTYPHVDMYETGKRAGETVMRALRGEARPVMLWRSLPMLTHMLRQTPATQPMKDIMDVLEEVMRQGLEDVVAGPIWDPVSVAQMAEAGIGAEVTLALGGKTDMPALKLTGRPLTVSGRVRALTDGRFTITGPMATGTRVSMGRTAVLETPNIDIIVSERRFEPFDTGCFTHCGIDPARKRYVLIKSRQHFRAGFGPIAKHVVLIAGPGVCSSDYDLFPFENLRRPIYPLDPDCPRNA